MPDWNDVDYLIEHASDASRTDIEVARVEDEDSGQRSHNECVTQSGFTTDFKSGVFAIEFAVQSYACCRKPPGKQTSVPILNQPSNSRLGPWKILNRNCYFCSIEPKTANVPRNSKGKESSCCLRFNKINTSSKLSGLSSILAETKFQTLSLVLAKGPEPM